MTLTLSRALLVVSIPLFWQVDFAAAGGKINGIYGCDGYFTGNNTQYQNINTKISLNVTDDGVSVAGDYEFFGTNVANPLFGNTYLNCGVENPPEFTFKEQSCQLFNDKMMPIVQDFGIMNMATMRLTITNIANDAHAEFNCQKVQ